MMLKSYGPEVSWRQRMSAARRAGAHRQLSCNVSIPPRNASKVTVGDASPLHHRNRSGDLDAFGGNLAAPCQDFDAFLPRAVERRAVDRVDVARHGEALGRRNLDDEEQHGAGAGS